MSTSECSTATLAVRIADIVAAALPEDERLWVPQASNVWCRRHFAQVGLGADYVKQFVRS